MPYQLQRWEQRTDDERKLPSIEPNAHMKRYLSGIRTQRNLIQVHASEVCGWLVVDTYCPYNVLKMNSTNKRRSPCEKWSGQ
jgi:hypothetical protein